MQYRSSLAKVEVGSVLLIADTEWRVVSFDHELRTCRVQPADAGFEWYDGAPPRAPARRD
jgi:hypothetical protein